MARRSFRPRALTTTTGCRRSDPAISERTTTLATDADRVPDTTSGRAGKPVLLVASIAPPSDTRLLPHPQLTPLSKS
jgi:hypothetical protein